MTADEYLKNIIANKKANNITIDDWRLSSVKTTLTTWAGLQLSSIKQSGSIAKGTALKGIADFDIFISLKADTTNSLKDIYDKLDTTIKSAGWVTRRQNVSIGITHNNLKIDLVPGKIQSGYQNYHSIYSSKKDTWMQTNVDLHITKVKNSNRVNEIILTKIWKHIHGLDFPSIYLELTVLNALNNKPTNNLASNFLTILTYLKDKLVDSSVTDPSNTNNKISDMLYKYEKETIALKAKTSLENKTWGEIIW
ncbi:SMODS domain-containing nucleotidyltransferase [Flavobacterium sp. GNP002]